MKKIIFGMVVLVIAGIVALNVNLSAKKSDAFSLLALANIEALAQNEDGAGGYVCVYGVQYGGLGIARACESCTWQFFLSTYKSVGRC